MSTFEKRPTVRTNLMYLMKNSVILYNGKYYIFDRIPQGANSIYVRCLNNLKYMKIPISNIERTYFDVVGYFDSSIINPPNDLMNLEKGDLFVINQQDKKSLIFRFERRTDNTIIASNPMNNKEIRIRIQFDVIYTKLENMPF